MILIYTVKSILASDTGKTKINWKSIRAIAIWDMDIFTCSINSAVITNIQNVNILMVVSILWNWRFVTRVVCICMVGYEDLIHWIHSLANVLSAALRCNDSAYPFRIFKPFLIEILKRLILVSLNNKADIFNERATVLSNWAICQSTW